MLENISHTDIGKHGRSQQIAEQPRETGSRTSRFFRNQIQSRDSYQHYRTVNEKSYRSHSYVGYHRRSTIPININRQHNQQHINNSHRTTTTFKNFIGKPTTKYSSENTGYFERKIRPTAIRQIHVLHLFEIHRRPI